MADTNLFQLWEEVENDAKWSAKLWTSLASAPISQSCLSLINPPLWGWRYTSGTLIGTAARHEVRAQPRGAVAFGVSHGRWRSGVHHVGEFDTWLVLRNAYKAVLAEIARRK